MKTDSQQPADVDEAKGQGTTKSRRPCHQSRRSYPYNEKGERRPINAAPTTTARDSGLTTPVGVGSVRLLDLVGGDFRIILADPPWNYRCKQPTERAVRCVRNGEHPASANHYYDTMKLADIKAMPVAKLAADASVLFLWATVPLLPDAFETMKAWGWKYKTMLTWHKTNRDCMGYWFRVCTEHLLVGVRGDVKSFRSMERTLLETPRGKHSEKPEAAYKLIETVTNEPRLELFARRKRPNWTTWGNEV